MSGSGDLNEAIWGDLSPTWEEDEKAFAQQIAAFIRENRPSAVHSLDHEQVESMARCGIHRAQRKGIEDPHAIALYVTMMFVVAPNFDEHPAIHARLYQSPAPINYLVKHVARVTNSVEWLEAKLNYNVAAWEGAARTLPTGWRPL